MRRVLSIVVLVAGSLLAACGGEEVGYSGKATPINPDPNVNAAREPGGTAAGKVSGIVKETMDSGGYTYVLVDTGAEAVWAASRVFPVKVGERIAFSADMPMRDFRAESLKRTFDLIYFCSAVDVEGTRYGMSAPAGGKAAQAPKDPMHQGVAPPKDDVHQGVAPSSAKEKRAFDYAGIAPPDGGKTVAEIFAERTALAGKEIVLRALVVKFTPNIMGKNWLHVRDGTGGPGTNDLTVTTAATAKAGDRVVINGKLSLDKDFGYGYKYDLIVEDAAVRVEPVSQD